ncbi:MAG: hypothetical protein ACM3SY_09340 [Candidatus Omnitrophota bacterium]
MKRFIIKVLLLLVLLAGLIQGLNRLAQKPGDIYKDGAALVCEKKRNMVRSGDVRHAPDKANVLFMGTSRILAGMIPAYFDALTGGKTFSYNLAFPALTISESYFVLKDYLDNNPPPQVIVISPDIRRCKTCTVSNYYAVQGMEKWSEILSLTQNLQTKSIIFNFLFPFRMYKYFTVQYVKDRLFSPESIRDIQKKNRAILSRMETDRGYYFIQEQATFGDNPGDETVPGQSSKRGLEYDPFDDPYVELFFDLAARYRIHVLLIQPAFREGQYVQHQEIPFQYHVLRNRYDNVSIAGDGWKMKFLKLAYFADASHLNQKGAMVYTRIIYNEFIECFKHFRGKE